MLDIFIAHAWRFHPEWVQLADLIENNFLETVRNFSLPWHDPAISPNSDYGKNFLNNQLKSQILPSNYLILIDDLFKVESNRRWLVSCLNIGLMEGKNFVIAGSGNYTREYVSDLPDTAVRVNFNEFENWLNAMLD